MADILFHPEAQSEYEAALGWYQARSVRAAFRFEREVERALEIMEAQPEIYPRCDDEHRFALLRRFPYSVVYRLETGTIYVIALAHSGRAAGYWKGRIKNE